MAPCVGHLGEAVLAGRLGLAVLGLALEAAAVELGDGLRHTGVRRVVEGLVTTATDVVGQTDLRAAAVGRLADVVVGRCPSRDADQLFLPHPVSAIVATTATAAILLVRRKMPSLVQYPQPGRPRIRQVTLGGGQALVVTRTGSVAS